MSAAATQGRPLRAAVVALQSQLRAQGATADPIDVVQAHIAAVRCGDPELMAADYTDAARITRGGAVVIPREYFALALKRLGSSVLVVHGLDRAPGPPNATATRISMRWELRGDRADGTRGTDTFTVSGDRITDQQVVLHTTDF